MLNSFNCVGNLANEPIFFDGDTPRTVFTLAVDHNGKPIEGKKNAEFLDFVAWGNTAKFIHNYCHKGDMLSVQNAMAKKREIVDADGNKTYRHEFNVESVDILRRAKGNIQE